MSKAKYLSVLLLLIPLTVSSEIDPDLKSIIESTERASEKPRIERGSCCPGRECPSEVELNGSDQCKGMLPILSYLKDSEKVKGGSIILQGKKYEVFRPEKEKRIDIIGRKSKKRLFYLKDGSEQFDNPEKKISSETNRKFVLKYKKLKRIFSDVKFRELCHYLAGNAMKYSLAIRKLKDKGRAKRQ